MAIGFPAAFRGEQSAAIYAISSSNHQHHHRKKQTSSYQEMPIPTVSIGCNSQKGFPTF